MITGAGGLIGSESALSFLSDGHKVVGVDNNARMELFGPMGDIRPMITKLSEKSNYYHENLDITNQEAMENLIKDEKPDAIIHCAAQPSHDKAASIPHRDFSINANGTLNLLEGCRKHAPECIFIHLSTNKVYGDRPNNIPMYENETRYDYADSSYLGISEKFPVDQCTHSLFGASKLAGDVLAQEYGRYFNMPVGVFRGGCLTGPQHAGVELHGFLSYIIKCAVEKKPYKIFGYKGKQVRDQIHCNDVVSAFKEFIINPRAGEVYNIGGCKENSASILEVIDMIYEISGNQLKYSYTDKNRVGDHICYYSDMSKFKKHYPNWSMQWNLEDIVSDILANEIA